MPRPIKLFPYDSNWVKKFVVEASDINSFLGTKCLEVHHFGSTSIPGMTAKEDLDILLVVQNLNDSLELKNHGFVFKGELNIPLRYFFSKNTERSKINLHVCESGHGFIGLNLAFRDYLRKHPKEVELYSQIKFEALKHAKPHEKIRDFLTHYGVTKNRLIKSILEKSGYEGFVVNFCMHHNEWEEYHRITKASIDNYVEVDPASLDSNHFYFCISKGPKIVAVADIDFLEKNQAQLISLCFLNKSHEEEESYFLSFLDKWLLFHDRKINPDPQ